MYLYHIASISKILLGTIILLIVYNTINVYQDPAIALGMGFIGSFILLRGIAFYIFLGIYQLSTKPISLDRKCKNSYKLSFLFGIYAMINVMLLLLGKRNKIFGSLLLIIFVILQIHLFKDTRTQHGI